jgi:hypothetical protein
MDFQQSAELQVALEGVALPAKKKELVAYARRQDSDKGGMLGALPDREYRTLDEVGEALTSVQPPRAEPDAKLARDEGGEPPGGESYTDPQPEPGRIRPSIPPSNPPEKTIEGQSKRRDRQQERQQQLR